MKFILEIDMDNDAFTDAPLLEVARIMRELAQKMTRYSDDDKWSQKLYDINGNHVGHAETCDE